MLDAKVCRTCQKTVDRKDGSSKLDEIDPGTEITLRTKLHVCVPEMMLGDSNEDVICMICTNMLNLSYMFRNICIKTEQARHSNVPVPQFSSKIKKEVPEGLGIIVTRLHNPATSIQEKALKSDNSRSSRTCSGGRNSRKSLAAAAAEAIAAASAKRAAGPGRKRKGAFRNRQGRFLPAKIKANKTKNVHKIPADEMNGGDDMLMDGNQEPLLEVAYEEAVNDSDDRFSTASDNSIGSLRDIPEVIVRDPNTNIPPGGRTLRTRQNVSYVMPPDSPETVQKSSTPSSSRQSTMASSNSFASELFNNVGGSSAASGSKDSDNSGGSTRKRANSGRVRASAANAAAKKDKDSPGQDRSRLQAITLANVDVIDDFCRRNNRDPLEFLCSVPMLMCDSDIGTQPPPHGIIPVIDNNQCDLCGQQLSRYAGLRRHRLRHFSNYSFCCAVCGRHAYERYEIREHLEKRHRIKPELVAKYIENSRLKMPAKSRKFRPVHLAHDPTCKKSNISSSSSRKRTNISQEKSKPGPKSSKTDEPTVIYNKPGPKSSKTSAQAPQSVPVYSRPGPKSSKLMAGYNDVEENRAVTTRASRSPQKAPIAAAADNVHPELKRRRISVHSTPVVSVKRKRPPQANSAGARFKYECVFCDVLVSDKDTLRVHLRSYHCNVCFKFFVGKSTRNAHHCLHVPQKVEDENYYLCLDCDDYKSKVHFLSHLEASKTRKLDQMFTLHPRPTHDSHSVEEKRRIVPTITCSLGKSNQPCYFFCGDPDALKFHQVRVHGQSKLLSQISSDKLTSFEQLEKQIRPVKLQSNANNSGANLSASLQDMQIINYVEDFVDVDALDTRDTDVDPMGDVSAGERCATCDEEMPNGPLEHECARLVDELYKCEICLNSFDRLSLIEHMKVHMNITVM